MLFGKRNAVDLSSSVMAVLCGVIRYQSKLKMSSTKIYCHSKMSKNKFHPIKLSQICATYHPGSGLSHIIECIKPTGLDFCLQRSIVYSQQNSYSTVRQDHEHYQLHIYCKSETARLSCSILTLNVYNGSCC